MGIEGISREIYTPEPEDLTLKKEGVDNVDFSEILKDNPQITRVETENADVFVHYGNHGVPQEIPGNLPVDVFALEFAGIDFKRFPDDTFKIFSRHFIDKEDNVVFPQLIPALERAEKDYSPVAFMDVSHMKDIVQGEFSDRRNLDDYDLLKLGLKVSTYGLLAGVVKDVVDFRKSEDKPSVTRRGFLKGAAAALLGTSVAGIDLAKQANELVKEFDSDDEFFQKKRRLSQLLSELLFEDRHLFTNIYRNLVWAQKVSTLSKTSIMPNGEEQSKISMVVGAAHVGVEKTLQIDEDDRLKLIEELATKLAEFDESRLVGAEVISIMQKNNPEDENNIGDDISYRTQLKGWDFMYVVDKKLEEVMNRVLEKRRDSKI